MKLKFEYFFRTYIFICVAVLGWSFWASAQSSAPITILDPKANSTFRHGTNITIAARVDVPTETVRYVEFLRDNKSLGIVSNVPYTLTWTNVPRGIHRLEVRMVNVEGVTNTSAAVEIPVHTVDAYLTFGLDRVKILTYKGFLGLPLWQYVASLIYIFLAFYVSKFLDFVTRIWLKRWASKTSTKLDDLLLELLNGPVKIVAFVIFLHIGLNVFSWPEWIESFFSKFLRVIVAVSITYTLLKAVDIVLNFWKNQGDQRDKSFDHQLFPIISKSLKLFILVVAVLVTWQNVSEKPITAILASLSIGGLAIGLAAQDTISNFFGAVVVFVDKPFRVGDRIKLPDVDGTVETIGLRSTRVRNLDGHLITVPNKTMGNATITNITKRPNIKTVMNIGITYDTPTEKVKLALQILNEIYKNHPKTFDLIVSFNQFADSSLNILVVHWWNSTDFKEYLAGMQELNLALKERFDNEGISFAFPSRTIYLKQDLDWRIASASGDAVKLEDRKG
ncbi:MAG: mechanosensitive ion channel [Verrucomicrobia bacterium]|nr:mechanosensitive ion channel [Verrucomicrobiota bacterium]